MKNFVKYIGWFCLIMGLFFVLTVNSGCAKREQPEGPPPVQGENEIITNNPLLEVSRDNENIPVPQNSSEGSNSDDN